MKTSPQHPAFPVGAEPAVSASHGVNDEGLTKREYFAALMMQGTIANTGWSSGLERERARSAVRHADALIEALNERSPA